MKRDSVWNLSLFPCESPLPCKKVCETPLLGRKQCPVLTLWARIHSSPDFSTRSMHLYVLDCQTISVARYFKHTSVSPMALCCVSCSLQSMWRSSRQTIHSQTKFIIYCLKTRTNVQCLESEAVCGHYAFMPFNNLMKIFFVYLLLESSFVVNNIAVWCKQTDKCFCVFFPGDKQRVLWAFR